jgi:hypothetical protein
LQVLGNNSKTVNNIKNLTWAKMISTARSTYPEVNPITHFGVIAESGIKHQKPINQSIKSLFIKQTFILVGQIKSWFFYYTIRMEDDCQVIRGRFYYRLSIQQRLCLALPKQRKS